MSHYIVKSIKVDTDGKATITAASNNVCPRTYFTSNMEYLTKGNPFTGKLGAEVEILLAYEEGQFKGRPNKFVKALGRLTTLPEYEAYNWKKDFKGTQEKRNSDKVGLFHLLAQALTA